MDEISQQIKKRSTESISTSYISTMEEEVSKKIYIIPIRDTNVKL